VIGCLHIIPLKYKGVYRVEKCGTGADFAVHPDYRKLGLGFSLGEHVNVKLKDTGHKFTFSITGNPKLIHSMPRDHVMFPGEAVNYVKIEDIDRQLEAYPMSDDWLVRVGFTALKGLTRLRGLLKGSKIDHNVEKADSFGAEADALWSDVENRYKFAVRRDSEYLNWKYCDYRVGGYQIRKTFDGDRLTGYCVFRINRYREEYPVGYISEIVTMPGRFDIAGALVKSAVDWFSDEDVNIVNFQGMESSLLLDVLEGHGFLNSRMKIHIFIKPFVNPEELHSIIGDDPEKILVSWGDYDVLPVELPR